MADSNITIVGLSAVGGVSQNVLQWAVEDPNIEGLPSLKYAISEIWMSLFPTMSGAVKLGEAFSAFADVPVPRGQARYYQVRAKNRGELLGEFTRVHAATEISGDVLLDTNGYWRQPSGLIHQWGQSSFPSPPGVANLTFPRVFPTAVLQFQVTLVNTATVPIVANAQLYALSPAGAGLIGSYAWKGISGSDPISMGLLGGSFFWWFAIGH